MADTLPMRDYSENILPGDTRMRIQAEEEYRLVIRSRMDDPAREKKGFWKERLFVPAVIAIMTLALSEWAVPRVIELTERSKRQTKVAAELMLDVAQNVSEMGTAADARSSAIDEFWIESAGINAMVGEFAVKRDIGEMTEDEFKRQDGLIENDRQRISTRHDKSVDEYGRTMRDFQTWLKLTQLRIETVYVAGPERDAAIAALAALAIEARQFDTQLDARAERYQTQVTEKIRASKDLRALLRERKITRTQYRAETAPILEALRNMKPLPVHEIAFKEAQVATILRFVQSGSQVQ